MKLVKHKIATLVLIALSIFAAQLGTAMSAFAADAPTDLTMTVEEMSDWNVLTFRVCNNGPTDITAFSVSNTFTNFTPTSYTHVIFADTSASPSTINPANGDWTGIMTNGQCVEEFVLGNVTGNVGDTFGMTSTIASATLPDSSLNVDISGDETASTTPRLITEKADLGMETRLLTGGVIASGTNVSYELTVKNTGTGNYNADPSANFGQPQVYFLMPAGATFVDLIDSQPGDILDISSCFPVGDIAVQLPGSGYTGLIHGCQLNINSGTVLPPGSSYKFELQILANSSFVSGSTEAIGIAVGNDEDTIEYFARLSVGEDFLATPIDNIFGLTFDSSALIPTINPCSGQGSVVSVNSACFTISFNKDIYEPEFTEDDLKLSVGNVSSFTKIGENLWEVRVSGMTLGSTLKVELIPGRIQDLSAVLNTTQVLGINTVRYEVATLPETGKKVDWITPLILLLAGFALLKGSKFYSTRLTENKIQS